MCVLVSVFFNSAQNDCLFLSFRPEPLQKQEKLATCLAEIGAEDGGLAEEGKGSRSCCFCEAHCQPPSRYLGMPIPIGVS